MTLTLLIGFSWYVHAFLAGQPVVTDEYLVKFDRLGGSAMLPAENAWPHYEKAISLFVEADEVLDGISAFKVRSLARVSESQRRAIVAWIEANEAAWGHLQQASRQRRYHRPLQYDRGRVTVPPLMRIMLPPLAQLRHLTEIAFWKARLAADEGCVEASVDHCLVIARVGAHLQTSVRLIEQLMGIAQAGAARSELLRLMARQDLSETALRDLQVQLTALYPDGSPPANFAGERLVLLDAVQHAFTRGGFGGGHLIPGQYKGVLLATALPEGTRPTMCTHMVLRVVDVALSMFHARRNQTVAKIHAVYDEIDRRSRLSPYQRHISGKKDMTDSIDLYRHGFILMLFPAEYRVAELAFQLRADHEATLAVLSLQRYHAETGSFPGDLKRLVEAGYLPAIPMDPFSDGPLVYKHVAGGFLLYSVSRDFIDGGGMRGVDDDGKPRPWAENGDRVFWPPAVP